MKPFQPLLRTLAVAAAVVISLGVSSQSHAVFSPAVEYTTSGTLTDSRAFTIGYEFNLSSAVTIDALAYWNDGLGNNHQVGIWDSAGNLLTSTTVLGGDTVQGHFRWHSIGAYTLAAGNYVIAGEYLGNGDPFVTQAQGVTAIPQYTWLGDRQQFGAGLNYPTFNTGGAYGNNGIFMVDFSVAAVPEPATYFAGALLVGIFGVQGFRSLRRRPQAA